MAFTVTWADGTATDYADGVHFEAEGGTLKIGMAKGQWTYYVSPSAWTFIDTDPPQPKERPPFPRGAYGPGYRPR
jgi:hypothetical protein